MSPALVDLIYLFCACCFIFGLKLLSSPETARRGNMVSAFGMLVAVVITLFDQQILSWQWIFLGLGIGTAVGIPAALFVAMTAMPEMVALLNGSGGLASLLLGWSSYNTDWRVAGVNAVTVFLSVLIGGVTCSGSIIAWGKLRGVKWIPDRAWVFSGQKVLNATLLVFVILCGVFFYAQPASLLGYTLLLVGVLLSLILGVMAVLPIGGADMPVVISLLNSYSGLAACMAGFVIQNNLLIVAGSLVGASGIILTAIMCKAMNRSLGNVLFSGFGSQVISGGKSSGREMKAATCEDAYYVLESASSVVIAPGYGLAVAQAQHAVKELGDILEANGAEVKYAIHPVAGRMPGHMNVLLAEANVPYDQLVEPEDVNPIMETIDVCIIVGANDTVNPGARDDETSPLFGMPIIEADRAKTVFGLKRGRGKGFAGIENPLFTNENTRMLFGDAKGTVTNLIAQFKEL